MFYKNHTLLNDCRITKDFVRLESRKNGYCNIVKLVIPDEKDEKVLKIITDPPKIRKHITKHFQEIFRGQDLDHNANMVSKFLLQDDDPAPYEEFL